jgi:hypothetical protein
VFENNTVSRLLLCRQIREARQLSGEAISEGYREDIATMPRESEDDLDIHASDCARWVSEPCDCAVRYTDVAPPEVEL